MVSVIAFKTRFLEFSRLPDATVAIFISDAELELDANVWGVLYEQGVCYLAASKLCASPYAQQSKIANATGESSYIAHYRRLQRRVAIGVGRLARP